MSLTQYRQKRHFDSTPEPRGLQSAKKSNESGQFVIQKHAATRLHYDFRLEFAGVLKSWAVPNGPSLDPAVKSLAVQVEDHPLEYATFEGTIPKGEYGGGTVMVWDRGTWSTTEDIDSALKRGKLTFELHGEKLGGAWALVRMHGRDSENWLLIKKQDDFARPASGHALLEDQPGSVATGRTLSEIADHQPQKARKSTSKKSRPKSHKVHKASAVERRTKAETFLPAFLAPQLAQLVKKAPSGKNWLHEIKLDGYRILARFDKHRVTLWTRGGQDWTHRFPSLVKTLQRLKLDGTWLDGEVIVEDAEGFSNFQLLQNALSKETDRDVIYSIFDMPWLDGRDITASPLLERKLLLEKTLSPFTSRSFTSRVRFHEHIEGSGQQVCDSACQLKLEGIVSKRGDSPYESKRSATWVKTKCERLEEFVIAGYTKPQGKRQAFGALLLGIYHGDELRYCGRVGTGYTEDSLRELKRRFAPLASDECPFARTPTAAQLRGVHWLQPKLVAQISYATRTADGLLRHAVFHGLREDLDAEDVIQRPAKPPR